MNEDYVSFTYDADHNLVSVEEVKITRDEDGTKHMERSPVELEEPYTPDP